MFCFVAQLKTPSFMPTPIEVTVIEPKKDKESAETERSRSIVRRSEGEEAKVAKKDSYLSEKTKIVKEERSAKNTGELAPVAIPNVKQVSPQEKQERIKKSVKLSDLGLKAVPKENPKYEDERNWAEAQNGESNPGGQYIKGLKEGETSALNTKEFVFFSYFERVRKQLDQTWPSILRENIKKIVKSGRKLASNEDYTTKILVTLNAKGEVTKVQLLEESGTHDVDQAAVDALNRAGPYPNPPKGLIGANGTVEIRWDFLLRT